MNWFQRQIRGLEQTVVRENPAWPATWQDLRARLSDVEGVAPPPELTKAMAITGSLPTFSACISKLVSLAQAVELYEADRDTGERLEDPRLLNAEGEPLLSQPNPGEGSSYFWQKSYQQFAMSGMLFHAVGNSMEDPRDIWCLDSEFMRPVPGPSDQYPWASFRYRGDRGARRTIPPEQVIYVRRPNPQDRVYGLSFYKEAQSSAELLFDFRQYNKNILRRGAKIGGVLNLEGFGEVERKRVLEMMREREGPKGAGRTLVTFGEGMTWTPDQTMPRDLEYATAVLEMKLEIYNVFGFMPALFATRDVNRSNLREAKASAYEDAVKPFVNLVLDGWNHSDLTRSKGVVIEANWEEVEALQPNRLEEARADAMDLDRGALTPNDRRRKLGLPEVEWGDEPLKLGVDPAAPEDEMEDEDTALAVAAAAMDMNGNGEGE